MSIISRIRSLPPPRVISLEQAATRSSLAVHASAIAPVATVGWTTTMLGTGVLAAASVGIPVIAVTSNGNATEIAVATGIAAALGLGLAGLSYVSYRLLERAKRVSLPLVDGLGPTDPTRGQSTRQKAVELLNRARDFTAGTLVLATFGSYESELAGLGALTLGAFITGHTAVRAGAAVVRHNKSIRDLAREARSSTSPEPRARAAA